MAALTRPLVFAALLLGVLVVVAPALLRQAPDLRAKIEATASGDAAEQSGAQLSAGEFAHIGAGVTPDQLRALAGDPAERSTAHVEGIELECWYYGAAGATGAYQLCFKDGRLATKLRFDRRGS